MIKNSPKNFVSFSGHDLGELFDVADELGVGYELIDGPEESVVAGKQVPVLKRNQFLELK